MWIFEATYENMDLDNSIKSVKRRIKFDGDNFFNTGEECYRNECLGCLEFIAC